MGKVGRNAPCPCGSGKKYKRCCLAKGNGAARFTQDERHSALAKLEGFIDEELGPEDDAAHEAFYARWDDRIDALGQDWIELSEAVYDSWFCFDYRPSGGQSAVDAFLDRDPPLTPGERLYLERMRDTAMRLYEVEDLVPGESVSLRDVAAGTQLTVHERLGSRSFCRHDLLAARIIRAGASGRPEIEPGILHVPDLVRRPLLSRLGELRESHRREHPSAGEAKLFKELAPFFHDAWMSCLVDPPIPQLKNTDGDDLVITRVRFDVTDQSALEAALDRGNGLEREEEGRTAWRWSGRNAKGEAVSLGRIAWEGPSLELECNSAQRGERGRALIEALGGDGVRHRSTIHENVAMAVRDQLRAGASPGLDRTAETPEALPPEQQEALTLDALGRHYRKWLDEPVPALDDHTPREAAADAALRPKLADLIRQLEGMYQAALKRGDPAYDPSWMWNELGLEDQPRAAHPPPLAHERMASMLPGLGELCPTLAGQVRQRPGFDDVSTIVTAAELETNLEVQRFLRERRRGQDLQIPEREAAGEAPANLAALVPHLVNFELHRRKTFWVDEALAYMLAQTDLDLPGRELRVPFPSFALVFTDRHVLSLAERMLSADRRCPLAGQFLRAATVYVTEERLVAARVLHVGLAMDALGADPPHLVTQDIPLADDTPLRPFLESLAPRIVVDPPVPDSHPLRGLLYVTLNAILYATSAGVEPELRRSPGAAPRRPSASGAEPLAFSSESVYFLPGAIEISRVRRMQELERVPSGRSLLHRFMVRGHWRRAAAGWEDQRLRWIEPYWKGPDIAAVIERTYRLEP